MDRKFEVEFTENEPIFLQTADLSDYNNLIFEDCEIKKIEEGGLFQTEIITNDNLWIYDPNLEQVSEELEKINLKSHVCKVCKKKFSRLATLNFHAKTHEESGNDQEILLKEEEGENEEAIKCSEVDLIEVYYEDKPIAIETEDKEVDTQQTQNIITPKVAEKSTTSSNSNKIKKYECPECSKLFLTRQKMQRHLWIHRKKLFVCEICSLSFETNLNLEGHRLAEHAKDKPYVCNICFRSFASRQGLWEHKIHHNASPFFCEACQKSFNSRQGLLIHKRFHSDERPFVCTYCSKAFRDTGTLRKHQRIHTGERPHACPLCPEKNFNQKVVLREHLRWIHTSEKKFPNPPFTCSLCSFTLSDREELCIHLVKHSDQISEAKKKLKKETATATSTVTSSTIQN